MLGRDSVPQRPNDAAPASPFILVNVGSRGAREEILEWLAARGYAAGVGCVAVG